jgi:uncharacterized protein
MNKQVMTAILIAVSIFLIPVRGFAIELQGVVGFAESYHNPGDPELEKLFRGGLVNTMRQSVRTADGTVYVQTGDIKAEWLRDASAQVRLYLFFANTDPQVAEYLRGVIMREGKYIRIDPYANAFTQNYLVHERKFELDSLAYPVILAWTYWKVTGDGSIFNGDLSLAFDKVLQTMEVEQDHSRNSSYRRGDLPNQRKGRPVAHTGMIWTGFRPSDDACQYNFLIPSEMMAVSALANLEEIERVVYHDDDKAARAQRLRKEVHEGIQRYGIVQTAKYGPVYAYEVDGLGGVNLRDDANAPSLLSAPYFGYGSVDDPIYQHTRAFVLSVNNPDFHSGSIAQGIGSQHTHNNNVWPLSLIMQAMTSQSPAEKQALIAELLASDSGDHTLHESFDPNDATKFTRQDFGWPNALFSEFLLTEESGKSPLPVASSADLQFRTL